MIGIFEPVFCSGLSELLWSSILLVEKLGAAEVADLDQEVFSHKNILRLQIVMDQSLLMKVSETGDNLSKESDPELDRD